VVGLLRQQAAVQGDGAGDVGVVAYRVRKPPDQLVGIAVREGVRLAPGDGAERDGSVAVAGVYRIDRGDRDSVRETEAAGGAMAAAAPAITIAVATIDPRRRPPDPLVRTPPLADPESRNLIVSPIRLTREDREVIYVAFLRAINLGRVNRVPMRELRGALTDAGFSDVATHLQSGNVVLAGTKRTPTAVAIAVENLVRSEFGVDTDVMVRTAVELAKIVRANPLARRGADAGGLHVAFLKARPTAAAKRALAGRTFGDDEFVIRGPDVYLRYPRGVAGSKLSTPVFERALGTPATVRTWKVVTRLDELAAGA
jgi:uncharacterized protein (DUF1697 family)